ncbi:MAG: flavodoxin family protein [Phycisphaerae bacterium]|nr:flavodoxin family protein [Phycisphaerae bacterium]
MQSSPNHNGLTATIAKAALDGAKQAGAQCELVHLNDLDIGACKACGEGWGTCAENGICVIEDGFGLLRDKMRKANAIVFSTPVYYGDFSESLKCFMDRLRRCEPHVDRQHKLSGKLTIAIAAAGGGGGGVPPALQMFTRYFSVLGLDKFDLMGVTQRSRPFMLDTAMAAGRLMVETAAKTDA